MRSLAWRARGLGALVTLAAAAVTSSDAGAFELAARCADNLPKCEGANIAFSKTVALPVQGGFDTGWVPANSPLQVHLFAQLYAESSVDLAGKLRTSWPEPLTLATPGTPGAGALSIHYGVDVGAEAALTITVLGQTYSWTGDIPFVPQFDFQVDASETFDPWAFDGFSVDGSTMQETLAQVDVTDLIGASIPGLSGGFELDAYVDLAATYTTKQILLTRSDTGELILGGPITAQDDESLDGYLGGPSVDFDVQPKGEVLYDGNLHLVPAFYVELLGQSFSIPIADIPIPFSFLDKEWTFDPVTVHVPLPDITLGTGHTPGGAPDDPSAPRVVDLGQILVGDTRTMKLPIGNEGEENLVGTVASDEAQFVPAVADFSIDPGMTTTLEVDFTGAELGDFVGHVHLSSNDPDEPVRDVEIRIAVVEELSEGGGGAGAADAEPEDGCDCRTGTGDASGGVSLALLAGLTIAARRRRR